MDGPILAEFSSLNSVGHQPPSSSRTERPERHRLQSGGGSRTERSDRSDGGHARNERLLRGETQYTSAMSDGLGCANEHFIDDQVQGMHYGLSQLLPQSCSTEERERLLRRLEMCAKAREDSTKIASIQFAQRDAVKNTMKRERQQYLEKMTASQCDRDERWSRKLQRSPLAVDLVAENQRIDEENRVRGHVEQRRQRLMAHRNREAHNSIFKRATAEADELEQLRTEKRLLLENEKQLKALRDVERSNARTAQILQERRRADREKKIQMQQCNGLLPQVGQKTN